MSGGFYDSGRRPIADHDPQQQIQWEIQKLAKGLSVDIGAVIAWFVDAAKGALEELIKEVVDQIVGFVTDPETMLDQLGEWALNVPKLIGGLLPDGIIPGLDASKIISGAFNLLRIPGLDASKIISGVLGTSLIPDLDASKIVSGALDLLRIPGLDASKIISGVLGSGLIPGLDASKIVSGVLGGLRIPGLDASKITSGSFAQSMIAGLTTDLGTALTNAGNAITKAQGWLDGFWNGITGQNETNIAVADAQAQAAAISETQSAQSAAIAALQAQNDGTTFQGINGTDSLDRVTASGLGGPSLWAETLLTADTGAYTYCNGSELKMVDGAGASPHHYRYRCLIPGLATTLTDYQKIIITCGADQQEQASSSNTACWRVYFRVNTAETQYGFIEIGGNNLAQWGYKNGGSDTFVGSAFACTLPTAGTNFTLRIGTTAGIRYYELYRNGTFVNRWIDSTNLVVTGPNNHGWGFGVRWGTRFFGQATPASVGSVSIADNLPPTILGSGFRAYNSSGSSTPTVTGTQKFPSNFFNATAIKSDDLTYTPGTSNRLTISVAGWYMVKMQQQMSYGGNVSKHFYFALFRNGSVEQISGTDSWTSNWSSTSSGGCEGTFIIYCAAGDYLEPGYDVNSSTGGLMPGDAAGLRSYWSVSLLNRSYV